MWRTSVLFVCLATICSSCGEITLILCLPSLSLSLYDRDRDNSTPVLQVKCVTQAWPITPLHFSGQRDFLGIVIWPKKTQWEWFPGLLWNYGEEKNHFYFAFTQQNEYKSVAARGHNKEPENKATSEGRAEIWREEDWWHSNLWIHLC